MSHLRREGLKLLLQKRTYFGWAGLFVVPFLMATAFYFESRPEGQAGPQGDSAEFYLNTVGANGLYLAIGALFVISTFLLPLLAAVSGGQALAGEAERGTLRTALMQPVKRGAFLTAKWAIANAYIAGGLLILLAGSVIAGAAFFGFKPMLLLSFRTVSVAHGFGLIALAYLFVFLAMAATVSLAVLFSTMTDSALTAMVGSMVLVIVMLVLGNLPALDFLHPYLFTGHSMAWPSLFVDPINWDPILDALLNFAVWIAVTTGAAWWVFRRKDVRS